jgi:hypothetical protein
MVKWSKYKCELVLFIEERLGAIERVALYGPRGAIEKCLVLDVVIL